MNISAQAIGQVAGIIALISVVPYLVSIFKGKTKPSRAAYAIWLVIDTVTVAGYIASGARTTAWVFLAFTFTTIVIFILSLRYGVGGFNKLDLCCLGAATIIILLWVSTGNPLIALYMGLSAKMLGYFPIVKKAYLQPVTENALSWSMAAAASTLNLLALTSFQLHIALAPFVTTITDVLIAILLIFPGWRLVKSKRILPESLKDY